MLCRLEEGRCDALQAHGHPLTGQAVGYLAKLIAGLRQPDVRQDGAEKRGHVDRQPLHEGERLLAASVQRA